jgi:hypothetical protein
MGDLTISERDYNRLKEGEARARVDAKLAREGAERAGVKALKEGRKGEGLKLIGGANAPALQAIFGGAALYYLATGDWFANVQTFKDHWYLKPLLVIGIGYWLWRRQSTWAMALLSAGAALFVQAWKQEQDRKKKAEDAKKAGGTNTSGVDDAGRWDWSDDTYGRGRWVETPSGGRAYMTEGSGARAAERVAERVFEHARAA